VRASIGLARVRQATPVRPLGLRASSLNIQRFAAKPTVMGTGW
jgi:hypothetical protein